MTKSEAIAFIQAADWRGSSLGLSRIRDLLARLGDPQKRLRFVHVAGSNGKGSTCAMLASILTAAGYKTGLYTSPHLRSYNERMRINGADISDADFCAAAETVRPQSDAMEDTPTEFERITAMALLWFARQGCDIVVLEVGLGGRLDATNAIPAPEAAVIASISLEHTEILGDTLSRIAAEKAGIIKPGAEVILIRQSPEAETVVRETCQRLCCPLHTAGAAEVLFQDLSGQRIRCQNGDVWTLGLLGPYQAQNAALALETVAALRRRGFSIPAAAVRRGLETVRWPGRFQLVHTAPPVLLDGAHNPGGAAELAECLRRYLPGRKVLFVMGVMADKDYDAMLDTVAPFAAGFFTVTPENHRSLRAGALCQEIRGRLGLPAQSAGSVREGITLALQAASADGAVCIFGSLYQAGEVLDYFEEVGHGSNGAKTRPQA